MFIEERHQHILALIREKGRVEVAELSKTFEISEDSARRDLRLMEEKGLVKRTYGGAILPNRVGEYSRFQDPEVTPPEIKTSLAKTAASLVRDGDTILLDASSTIAGMVPWLDRIARLTIITNSVTIAYDVLNTLHSSKLFIIGGVVDPDRANTTSIESLKTVQNITVDKAFIGPCSISPELELWSTTFDEAELKKTMIKAGREVIILTDSSKFGQCSLAKVGPLHLGYQLITDQSIKTALRLKLQKRLQKGLTIVSEGDNHNDIG